MRILPTRRRNHRTSLGPGGRSHLDTRRRLMGANGIPRDHRDLPLQACSPRPADSVAGRWTGTPSCRLDDAVAVLGRFPALAGVTLTVHRGEIVWLRGPNGAGKTTLLRLCAGLVALTRGSGTVLGCDLRTERDRLRSARRRARPQQRALPRPHRRRERRRSGVPPSAPVSDEIASVLDRLGLAQRLASLPVRRLSAGQQRRTAIALPDRPAGRAVAARRTALRPRRRRPGRHRPPAASGGGLGRHRDGGQPRVRPGRAARHPDVRRRRRHDPDGNAGR